MYFLSLISQKGTMPFMKFSPWLLLPFLTLTGHSGLCLSTTLQGCILSWACYSVSCNSAYAQFSPFDFKSMVLHVFLDQGEIKPSENIIPQP